MNQSIYTDKQIEEIKKEAFDNGVNHVRGTVNLEGFTKHTLETGGSLNVFYKKEGTESSSEDDFWGFEVHKTYTLTDHGKQKQLTTDVSLFSGERLVLGRMKVVLAQEDDDFLDRFDRMETELKFQLASDLYKAVKKVDTSFTPA